MSSSEEEWQDCAKGTGDKDWDAVVDPTRLSLGQRLQVLFNGKYYHTVIVQLTKFVWCITFYRYFALLATLVGLAFM